MMALNSGFNIVPQDMLSIRRDTPRRLRKYNQRGFGAILPGVMLPSSQRILERCEEPYEPTRFMDMEKILAKKDDYDAEDAAAHILRDNRVYTETVRLQILQRFTQTTTRPVNNINCSGKDSMSTAQVV